jgi:hypothetical protein
MQVLINPTKDKNGLKVNPDKFNPTILNVTKFSVSGRSNGLVMRFNTKTREPIFDGSTWRSYKPYNHATIEEIVKLITKN